MDTNETMQNPEDVIKRKQNFEALKNFLASDMKIKEMLVEYAPTEMDEVDEASRIEYIDKLYKGLRDFKYEFIRGVKGFGFEETISKSVEKYFSTAKSKMSELNYRSGACKKAYQMMCSDMRPELVEKVKEGCVGYYAWRPDLQTLMNDATTINELLHVMHSYITNNDKILSSMPVIDTKENSENYSITLYGDETLISRKIFDSFPVEMDYVGGADIVSMENKVLMMIRDRGHALTIDIDSSDKDNISVKYFIPKICNEEKVKAVPGINTSKITKNGATGMFIATEEDLTMQLMDFIDKVPTDRDIVLKKPVESSEELEPPEFRFVEEDLPKFCFVEEDAKAVAESPERKSSKIQSLREKLGNVWKGITGQKEGGSIDDRADD